MVIATGKHLTLSPVSQRPSRLGRYVRRPCRCGAETRPGRGNTLCEVCAAEREAYKLCHGCGAEKPSGRGRRLCDSCDPVRPRNGRGKPCYACGSRDWKPSGKYCLECAPVVREAAKIRKRALVAMNRKVCRGCLRPKGPGRRHYCARCQKERAAPRRCQRCSAVVGYRRKVCDPCKDRASRARRKRELAKLRGDPVLYKKHLAYQRAYTANQRKGGRYRRGKQKKAWVPAAPLGAALMELGQAELAQATGDLEVVAARAGQSVRSVRRWADGTQTNVELEIADGVLLRIGWTWFDVYDPERWNGLYSPLEWIDVVDRACYAWTGERCLAVVRVKSRAG